MMCAVRRFLGLVATLVALVAAVAATPGAAGTATGVSPLVRTVLGPAAVEAPGGIALDTAGDLFVADTGHCRVLVVPARAGTGYGLHLRPGHAAIVAGGSCSGAGSIGHPSGVAVDARGDVYIAEATAQRVQVVRPGGPRTVVTVAGTGDAGFNGDGLTGPAGELDEPTAVAVDGAGDVFIADTANCRVRVVPARSMTLFGRAMAPGHLYTAAGTGVCGTAGQGGAVAAAQLWDPVAVAVDGAGNLLVADSGDQSVLLAAAQGGTYGGTPVGAGDIAVVVGGTGSYQPYFGDGLPATGVAAELNDPRGVAVGPTGALFVTDGSMHVIRVVPSSTGVLYGRAMKAGDLYSVAGAIPVATAEGLGDGTRWILTRMGTPVGIAVSPSGAVYYSDATLDAVREIGGP
jgi:glucose/arabinose dehydrogenase